MKTKDNISRHKTKVLIIYTTFQKFGVDMFNVFERKKETVKTVALWNIIII